MEQLELNPEQRLGIARRKAACPFIGSAVASGDLPVFGSVERPLAKVADVAALGDSGGGDLGRLVLQLFAIGNHSRLPDLTGAFNGAVSEGFFSLDFPGSAGAHPGDSGILIEDPMIFESGRLSMQDFDRLSMLADARGMLSIGAVGQFIADNVRRDSRACSEEVSAFAKLCMVSRSLADVLRGLFRREEDRHAAHVHFLESFTALTDGNDLVRSSGEFGLLFAFLANRPGAVDGRISLSDVEAMMVNAELPQGWRDWPKSLADWVKATGAITLAAWRASDRN